MDLITALTVAGGASAGGGASDPNFNQTVLLLHGDGTNGAQNNTFLDSSTNNFTITRNGNTTQGTFSPFSAEAGKWSNYFDGSGDYLTVPDNAAWDLGSGNFTIETWVYPTASPNQPIIVGQWSNPYAWVILLSNDGNRYLRAILYDGSFNDYVSSTSLQLNAWNHCAFVRESNTVSLYLNGSRVFTTTYTGTVSTSTTAVSIGADASGGSPFQGYISNTRVIKGTALYSGTTYTVPTTPLTAISGTELLTCQSNRFVDNSSNAFAITPAGNVSVQPFSSFAPSAAYSVSVNGGSGYFDGSGDWLSAPNNAAFGYGTGAFTFECWIYRTSTTDDVILTSLASGENNRLAVYIASNKARVRETGIADLITSSADIPVNAWTHIATARSGTTLSLWINGSRSAGGTTTDSTNFQNATPQIGANSTGTNPLDGYLSNLRVVKGRAVYDPTSTTLSVPTAPLTATSGGDDPPQGTETSLLLSGTNAGIFDNTGKNNLETVGNAQIDTTTKKYGTGSLEFDGTGDYLAIPNSANLNFGSGDFTIEFWLYPSSVSGAQALVSLYGYSNNRRSWYVGLDNDELELRYDDDGTSATIFNSASGTIVINQWQHIAYVRNGSSFKGYINGVEVCSSTSSVSLYNNTVDPVHVGVVGPNLTEYFTGFIDDLRITKGVARYTSAFTPPTAALPDL